MGKRNKQEKYVKYSKEELSEEIKRFVMEFNRVPIASDFEKLEGYPSRKTIINIFGNFNDAIRFAGFTPIGVNFKEYNEKCKNKEFIKSRLDEFIKIHDRVPTKSEFEAYLKISIKDIIKELFGSWNNLLKEEKLQLNQVYAYDDETLKTEFFRFVSENDRIPTWRDFNKNKEYPSFWCYQNRFGSWNNAVKNYGFNTQEDLFNFSELAKQLLDYCINVKILENRNVITVKEIENNKEIASYSCFTKHFKRNGYTVKSFLNDHGFDIPNEGQGMNYFYKDGEKILSQYEFEFSQYLRNILNMKYNIDYFRDVKYKSFTDCKKNINCDYVISFKNRIVYIEIAGILKSEDIITYRLNTLKSKSKEHYRLNLIEKENLFINSNLEYFIFFPCDFKEEKYKHILNL